MNDQRIMSILLAPLVSEKSTIVAEKYRQFAFRVASTATKPEIKRAVEVLFKTEVESVRIVNIKGKQKRFRQRLGRRNDLKKAYVSLKPGQDINFTVAE